MKSKVLIHCMSLNRDIGVSYILGRLLKNHNCDYLIASNNNLLSKRMRLWNPDAVYFATAGRSNAIIKAYPKAKLFFCSGEGGETYDNFDEQFFLDNIDVLKRVERIFLWGKNGLDHVHRYIKENNISLKKQDIEKFVIVGHPRLDVMKFAKKREEKPEKITIGFIGNSSIINPVKKVHYVTKFLNNPEKYDEMVHAFDLLNSYVMIMNGLGFAKFQYSYRPYPLDDFNTYTQSNLVKQKKLSIDKSLDFSTWLNSVDIVIGDVSSTFPQIALSNIPFINISKIVKCSPSRFSCAILEKFRLYSEKYSPESIVELTKLIRSMVEDTGRTEIDYGMKCFDYLDYLYHSKNMDESSIKQMADDIFHLLSLKTRKKIGLPTFIVNAFESLLFLSQSINHKNDLDHFNYNSSRHNCSKEFDDIVSEIS
jgi:hypothetical protein